MEQLKTNETVDESRDFNSWLIYGICLGITLFFMFFFSVNSPIYTFNTHCDYNWYLTMGRGIVAGKVPYRDLFEQKGPITYFVFAFASLFPQPGWVICLIESVCISIFLYFAYRIARKFLSPWLSLAVIPLTMMLLSTFYCGLGATRVEEFCLPIFAYALLCFLDFLMDRRPATWRRSLALGICLGILFWVKFSMWEFFLMPMLIWLVINLVHRNFLVILRTGLIMLAGVLLVTLPVLIYFAVNGALDALWEVYFQINIGTYNGDVKGLSESKLQMRSWLNSVSILFISPYFFVFFVWGIVCFAVQYWRQKSGWLMLIAVIPTWIMIGFFCGYPYYYMPLYAYALLGVIYAIKAVTRVLCAVDVVIRRQWVRVTITSMVVVVSFLLALPFVYNIQEINQPRENYIALVVADIIKEYNQSSNRPATLFCYEMADCGFYNAIGLIPSMRYYAQNAFTEKNFPEMYVAFDETIRNQTCDFVVMYSCIYDENEAFLSTYYDFYFGTREDSTLPYVFFAESAYHENEIVILFRK